MAWLCENVLLLELITGNKAQDRVLAIACETECATDAELNVVLQFGL